MKIMNAQEFIKNKLIISKEDWLREMEAYKDHYSKAENLPISDVRLPSILELDDIARNHFKKYPFGVIPSAYDSYIHGAKMILKRIEIDEA